MTGSPNLFTGSIPENYDKHFVPLIFAPYAADMAAQVAALMPKDVLEVAAGTGAVTRALAAALSSEARLVATDLSPDMLAYAQSRATDGRTITWRQADALDLPFSDDSFDAVLCQFGVMFFPDRVQGYREARRVLRSGGTFLFNSWDNLAANPIVATVSEAMGRVFPDKPSGFLGRVPHGYFDVALIERDMRAAGFEKVDIKAVDKIARAASAEAAAKAYCLGTPMRSEIEAQGIEMNDAIGLVASAIAAAYGSGAIESPIRAFVVTAQRD